MRATDRLLPSFLALLIPLGILGWVGSTELRRQDIEAARAFEEHARVYLAEASGRIEGHLLRTSNSLLSKLRAEDGAVNTIERARSLGMVDRRATTLVVLDGRGELVFPKAPLDKPPYQTLRSGRSTQTMQSASVLWANGDREGGLQHLVENQPGRNTFAARYEFLLASYLRNREPDQAPQVLKEAILGFERTAYFAERRRLRRAANGLPTSADLAILALLSEVALAELTEPTLDAGQGFSNTIGLLQDIAHGRYDPIADGVLEAVIDRLVRRLPSDDPSWQAQADQALNEDDWRLAGRRFAAADRAVLRESLRRLATKPGAEGPVYALDAADESEPSLIALRRATAQEQFGLDREGVDGAAWVGLRLDLRRILDESALLGADDVDFSLQARSPDGRVLWPTRYVPPRPGDRVRPSIGGILFAATPVDPDSALADRRDAFRNRWLMLVALCVAALGGAFFLVRSAGRESELASLRVELMSRVTHDLKTPLALIRMYADTITMGRSNDAKATKRFASVIAREADTLTRTIERVLDFSRREAGGLRVVIENIQVSDVVESATTAFLPHAEANQFVLIVGPDDDEEGETDDEFVDFDPVISVDRKGLESALLNLLENALKYTPSETADKRIELVWRRPKAAAKPHDSVWIEVRDRGIGIPAGERDRVFQGFYRASNAGEVRGTGLGLATVRDFARAHGGDVSIVDNPAGGTTVRVELPCAQMAAEADCNSKHDQTRKGRETQDEPCNASS